MITVILSLTKEQIYNLLEHIDDERAYCMDQEDGSCCDAWDELWWQLAPAVGIEDPLKEDR